MTVSNSSVKNDVPSQKNTYIYTGALLILLIASVVIFGFYVLAVAAVSYGVALIIEYVFAKLRKRPFDKEWMVTPLLLTLLMPPAVPLWLVGIASFFAVFFGKSIFGGSGRYLFTPALVGAVFVLISFPSYMAINWVDPVTDIVGGATPLMNLNGNVTPYPYGILQLLMGNVPGSIGETFRLGIIVLGMLLIVLKIADWRIPTVYIGTFFVLTAIFYYIFPEFVNGRGIPYGKDPFVSLFVGGLLLGAFFIAIDPVTAPMQPKGRIVYAIGLGFLTFLIRNFGTFQEGVTFSILIMSAISPLIDGWTSKQKKVEEEVQA